MKAIIIRDYGGRERLQWSEVADPEPVGTEVRIRVGAAGVNPVDCKIREGLLAARLPNVFPIIPGWDAAGIVDRLGPGATRFKIGDEVFAYCRKPVIQFGAYAEYVCVEESSVALKPRTASFQQAAAIPLAALTAWQSLFDAVALAPRESVLIHAAAGGVGSFAVQLARYIGCTVMGTASARHHDYLRSLGVDHCIDYSANPFENVVRTIAPEGVDVVYDCVGGEVMDRSVSCLKSNGRLVSILEPDRVQKILDGGVTARYVFVAPNGDQLETLARRYDEGALEVQIAASFPLEDAARAHELIESRHVAGKIVLTV